VAGLLGLWLVRDLCTAMSRGEQPQIDLMLQTQFTERHDDTEEEVIVEGAE
jgi:hypothetical protein